MNVTNAVASRRSVRAFLDRPIPADTIREVLALAARAPSGGNLQPWRLFVLTGETLGSLKKAMQARLLEAPQDEPVEYDIYPRQLVEPYRALRFELGEQLYALLGIARENKLGRQEQFARNFDFFGAPAGLFCYVDRQMGRPQWADLGMYLQTVMLLLRERGLDSCPQEAWSMYHRTVAALLSPPDDWMLFCGMAIGFADETAMVNRLESQRLPLEQFATFLD